MTALGLLGPLLLAACGLGLLALLNVLRDQPLPKRLAYAYLAGVAWSGLITLVLSHFCGFALRRPLLLLVLLAPIVGGFCSSRGRGRNAAPEVPPAPRSPAILRLWAFPIVLVSLTFASLLFQGMGRPVSDWDGRATWLAHARIIRGEHSVDATTLREPQWSVNHPRYPPLLAVVTVATQEILGFEDDDRLVRPLYAAFLPVLLLLLAHASIEHFGHLVAASIVTIAATIPQVTFDPNGGAASTYSDLPMACLFGAGLLLLFDPRLTNAGSALGALLLGAAAATKTEGLGLALIAILGAGIARTLRARDGQARPAELSQPVRALLPAVLGVVLVALLLASWRSGISERLDEDYLSQVKLASFLHGARLLPSIASAMLASMTAGAQWGVFWIALPILLVCGWRGVFRRDVAPWLAVILLACLIPLLGYIVAPSGATWLVETTWSRFLLQLSIPIFVLAAGALAAILPAGDAIDGRVGLVGIAFSVVLLSLLVRRMVVLSLSFDVARHLELSSCPKGEPLAGKEDGSLACAIDVPSESQVVDGPLLVSGWAQEEGGPSEIAEIKIDGKQRRCLSFGRTARTDVETALPRLGNCDLAGYWMQIPFEPGDEGPHRMRIRIRSFDGRDRWLDRSFLWRMPPGLP